MASILQPSMTGGEIAPSLYGRTDIARYLTSLKTCRNFIVRPTGGVANRPGWRFVCEVSNSNYAHRLLPFEFSTEQTYILEAGEKTMRFIKNGGIIVSGSTPVSIATPWASTDLPDLNWTQNADTMTVCHPNYAPRQITRTSHTNWMIMVYANEDGPFQVENFDTGLTVTASAPTGSITITASSAIFAANMVGTLFYIEQKDVGSPWEAGKTVAAGDIRRSDGKYYQAQNGATTGGVPPTHESDSASDGAVTWLYLHPGHGIAKITGYTSGTQVSASVVKRIPDGAVSVATYKWAKSAWGGDQGYPRAVTYYQNRQVFAGSGAQPQRNWMSRTGDYFSYGISSPIMADDAIDFTIPGRQVNAVRHLLPLDKLTILTSGSEWVVSGGESDVITPDNIAVRAQGYAGAAKIPPIIANDVALYVQEKGKSIREFAYEFSSDKYGGQDLTQLAKHLFDNYTIVDWAYQQVPYNVVWCVRSDGVLLGLTYVKEQQVFGWHWHDTDGAFESVACISEDGEDAVYAVVRRTINGQTKRYVERLESRTFSAIEDAFFVDSGLSYDGRNTGATTIAITESTAGAGWTYKGKTFTLTASASEFASGDVGKQFHFPFTEDGVQRILRMEVTAYASATSVTAIANFDVPTVLRGVATKNWRRAVKTLAGLTHLEGKLCSVLADGNVHAQVTVSSGAVSLQYHASVVHVGLPITSDIETLSITTTNGETLLDKKKMIANVSILVENSRGGMIGKDADNLFELSKRSTEGYDEAIALRSGVVETSISNGWGKGGTILIRQEDPLPLTVLSIIPDLQVGGR